MLNAKIHNFGIFVELFRIQKLHLADFLILYYFWHFSEHSFTKCYLLSFTEFLNNINLNKYACVAYRRLLKEFYYSYFNLLINVTVLCGHSRSENVKCSAASLPLWRSFGFG